MNRLDELIFMEVPKPKLTEFDINNRLETCVPLPTQSGKKPTQVLLLALINSTKITQASQVKEKQFLPLLAVPFCYSFIQSLPIINSLLPNARHSTVLIFSK